MLQSCRHQNSPSISNFSASAYRKDEGGKLLISWFREDWVLFDHPNMDDSRAKDLLAEILDDGEIVRETFSPAGNFEADRLSDWEKLRDELMYKNRFFPKANIDLERLKKLLILAHVGHRGCSGAIMVSCTTSDWRSGFPHG